MKGLRRAIAAITLAVLCAPGTWLRTEVTWEPTENIHFTRVQDAQQTAIPGWSVQGVWHYQADSLLFGGFSGLVSLEGGRLKAFSDRGARFDFADPGRGNATLRLSAQPIAKTHPRALPDIEAASHNPANGDYWIALENDHALLRFDSKNRQTGMIPLDAAALGWTDNTGAEALVRLADGRFVIMPEGRRTGIIFASDPIESPQYRTFSYLPPIPGHAATDLAQLPDGRLLLLLRNLDFGAGGLPPFESKIAIAPAPKAESEEVWAPDIALDLAGIVPRENYEGMAVQPMADGRVAVWLISDDNLSVIQRTLLVKLVFDPSAQPE